MLCMLRNKSILSIHLKYKNALYKLIWKRKNSIALDCNVPLVVCNFAVCHENEMVDQVWVFKIQVATYISNIS